MTLRNIRSCEQCGAEYVEGTGATEDSRSRVRLTERFCSESCADAYNAAFEEDC